MRIVLVEFSPSGGLFQFAFQLGHGLAELGHDVELLTGPDPELRSTHPRLRVEPVLPTWHPAPTGVESALLRRARRVLRAVAYVRAWRQLMRELATRSPDVVQWAAWRFTLDGLFVRAVARRRPARVLVDLCHESRRPSWPVVGLPQGERLYRWSVSGAFRRMDAVLVLGERARDDLRAAWPGVRRVEVIPHGDEAVFLTSDVTPVERTAQRVLFFGTLAGYKGLDLLLAAWALLRERLPAAELVLAGAPGGDVDVFELQRRAAAIGGVEVRPGYVPMPDVAPLFGSARLVVAPYTRANQSGVVHLAHTFGRPVVATAVGDLSDVVVDGETGVLVPPGDAAALAAGIELLLSDSVEAARRGEAGRARLAVAAPWSEVARRVERIYVDLLAARPEPGAVTGLEVHHSLDAVAAEWDELADRVGSPPYARPGWYAAWLGAFAGGARLELLVLRRQGALVAVLPLLARRRRLCTPTNWHTPGYPVLAADDAAAAEILRLLFGLRRRAVTLGFLDPATAERVRTAAGRARYASAEKLLLETPYVDLRTGRPAHRLDAKSRRILARRRRRLAEQGTLSVQTEVDGESLEGRMRTWFAIESASWKGRQGDAVLSRPETTRFYLDLARWAAGRGDLLLAFLCLDARPIAFQFALADATTWYFLKTGYHEELRALGPGKLLMAELLEQAAASGRDRVELGGSADAYKLEWTSDVRPYVELRLFAPTPAGRVTQLIEVPLRRIVGVAVRRVRQDAARARGRLRRTSTSRSPA